jgi:integrase
MPAMPRKRPPYLRREVTRHGSVAWYFRRNGARIRIRGEYGSPEFQAAYRAALAGDVVEKAAPSCDKRSLAWLIDRYRESAAWTALKPTTRRQREAIFRQMLPKIGAKPFAAVDREHIAAARDKRRETPAQANHVLKTLRGLFKWAKDSAYVAVDPTAGVSMAKIKTEGHRTWTAGDVTAFEARWPIGTRQRLAMALLAFTGLRRGDVVRLGRQHVHNGAFELTLEKTGERVTIPVAPALAEVIAATPTRGMTYLETAYGRPMSSAGFGNWFREACDAARVPGTAHGLRKALATRAAEAGASEMEIAALFGWRGIGTSSIYTKAARRSQLARQGLEKALGEGTKKEHLIAAPDDRCGDEAKK